MKRRLILSLAVFTLLTLSAVAAHAENGNGNPSRFAGSLYLFGRDVPTVLGKVGVVGLGYEMNLPIGTSHWGLSGDFGYGVGNVKQTQSDAFGTFEDEFDVKHWAVRVGLDYWEECCEKLWYCGTGLTYMSTSGTDKSTGSPDFELEPYKVYGLDSRLGGTIKLSPGTALYGQTNFTIGRGSFEQTIGGTTFEEEQWVTMSAWRGGIRFNY